MQLAELICEECVLMDVRATSKKQIIQTLAEKITGTLDGVDCRDIVTTAMERERLGTTGVGSGVALPHARIKGVKNVQVAFARLDAPIDFESVDDRPVDLVALLVAPEDAGGLHLRALAKVARLLRREDMRTRLRNAPSAEALHILLTDADRADAA
jgi:PTS system nitrogen regulatory IIA component